MASTTDEAGPVAAGEHDDDLVVLLRGVNVGGVTIRSAALRDLVEELGFTQVRTVLASGNVLCRNPGTDPADAKRRIESGLSERFGYTAWVVLRTRGELRRARDGFPYDDTDATRQPYLVFCSDLATLAALREIAVDVDPGIDPTSAGPGTLYWNPPRGASTSTPFARRLAQARWASVTTTRNIGTVDRILALSLD